MNEEQYYAADGILAAQESALDTKSRAILLKMQDIANMLLPGSAETDGHETRPTVKQLEQEMQALEEALESIYEEMSKISETRGERWKNFEESQKQARKPK